MGNNGKGRMWFGEGRRQVDIMATTEREGEMNFIIRDPICVLVRRCEVKKCIWEKINTDYIRIFYTFRKRIERGNGWGRKGGGGDTERARERAEGEMTDRDREINRLRKSCKWEKLDNETSDKEKEKKISSRSKPSASLDENEKKICL